MTQLYRARSGHIVWTRRRHDCPQDLMNADAILIMGSSMAENHPVGFQWVMEARESGRKIIHVDPRFKRTSAMADIWVPLRAGSDIVLLGGLISYVLENQPDFASTCCLHECVRRSCAMTSGTRKIWMAFSRAGMRKEEVRS